MLHQMLAVLAVTVATLEQRFTAHGAFTNKVQPPLEVNETLNVHNSVRDHNHSLAAVKAPILLQQPSYGPAPAPASSISPGPAPVMIVQHQKGRGSGYLPGSPLYKPCEIVAAPTRENPGVFISVLCLLLGILCLAAVAAMNNNGRYKEGKPMNGANRDITMSTVPPPSQRHIQPQATMPPSTMREQPHYLTPVRSELTPPQSQAVPGSLPPQAYPPSNNASQIYSQGPPRTDAALGTTQQYNMPPYPQQPYTPSSPSLGTTVPPSAPMTGTIGPNGNQMSYRVQG